MIDIKKLGDIKLHQWMELKEYLEGNPDETKVPFQMINILCEISPLEARKMDSNKLEGIISNLNEIIQQKPNFSPIFKLGGVEYGFIPNLDEITAGEFVDLQSYETQFHQKGINLYKIMSVLYRPITQKASFDHYEIQPYDGKLNEAFKDMPIDVALASHVFFCDLGNDLLVYTQKSLEQKRSEKISKTQTKLAGALNLIFKDSTKNGGGLDGLSDYVTTISETFNQYRNYPFINALYLPVIGSTMPASKTK
jgi:hypothetical protein